MVRESSIKLWTISKPRCRAVSKPKVGVSPGNGRLMTSLLFGVSAIDPATYAAVAAAIVAAAVAASYVPSRGAARAVPLDALRAE